MTVPSERTRAIQNAFAFLWKLSDPRYKIKISEIRREARWLIKHYPADFYLKRIAEALPDYFGTPTDRDYVSEIERAIEFQKNGKDKS